MVKVNQEKNHERLLYQFSIAVVTNCHEFSGLKQHRFIVLHICRSEVQHGFHWVKIQVLAGGSSREYSAFPASRGCLHSLPRGPLLHLQSQQCGISDHLSLIAPSSDHNQKWFSIFKDPCYDQIGPTQIIQDYLLNIKIFTLITSAKSLFPWKVTYSQVPGIRMWTYFGGGETTLLPITVTFLNQNYRQYVQVK